ncbi:MAG TPA: hydrogenase nickel incorporation protein HypA [Ignisphaera sp.]|nr:hydrogenase nickel incorporation protein HypA [Ignisphaera sp.]
MHEWALAESIVLTIEYEAKRRGLKSIKVVEVVVGELQSIDRDVFEFALNELVASLRERGIDVHKVDIESEEARFRCSRCGHQWSLSEVRISEFEKEAIHFIPDVAKIYIRCPKCGSHDFEIVAGRGVYVKRLEFR